LLVAVLAVDFFLFLLPCFFDECDECDECLEELDDLPEAAGVKAAGAAAAGVSAAIAPATIPKVNKTEAIKVPDLFMGSPTVV